MKKILIAIALTFYIVSQSTIADETDIEIAKLLETKTFALSIDDGDEMGLGTAFYYGPNDLIVTNKHIVHKRKVGDSVNLYTATKDKNSVLTNNAIEAKIIYIDSEIDIALLAREKSVPHTYLNRSQETLERGMGIWQFGFAGGIDLMIASGEISGFKQDTVLHDGTAIIMNIRSSTGASGSPVVDKSGGLIGVLTGSLDDGNWPFAIPTRDIDLAIKRYLNKKITNEILFDGYINKSLRNAKEKDKFEVYRKGLFELLQNIHTMNELITCVQEYQVRNFEQLPLNKLEDVYPIMELNLEIQGYISAYTFTMLSTTGEEVDLDQLMVRAEDFVLRTQKKVSAITERLKNNSSKAEFRRFGYQTIYELSKLVDKSLDKAEFLEAKKKSNILHSLTKEENFELIKNLSIAYEYMLNLELRMAPLDYVVSNLPTMKKNYMAKGVSLADFNLLADGFRSLLKSKKRLDPLMENLLN